MTGISIQSTMLRVDISPYGAELLSIRDMTGREYLHDGASFWASRAPILFPIVGALQDDRHAVAGKTFTLRKHGFARDSLFEAATTRSAEAVFRLSDSETTRMSYPYKFELTVTHAVEGATLISEALVTNTGEEPMPIAFGFHPAFRWPLPDAGPKLSQVIDFALEETGPLSVLDRRGLVARETINPVQGRRLVLDDAMFQHDALIFLDLKSRSLRFGPAGRPSPSLRIGFEGMPHLGIWTKPGAPFLCIEPWSGYASPAGFCGPLTQKPGLINLAAGGTKNFRMSIELIL